MSKLLNVRPFKQSPSFCGPASLKIVFEYYGVKKSEKELARLSGATRKEGVNPAGIVRAAKAVGFSAKVKEKGSLKDLSGFFNKKIPVIINWFSTYTGHYSVLAGIDKKYIYLQDPDIGRIRKMPLERFVWVWFGFKKDFPVSKKDLRLRAFIVVRPK